IFNLPDVSFFIWPLVLCLDVLAILVAMSTGALLSVLAVLVLTLVALGGWVFRIPGEMTGLPSSLFLIGGCAVFFSAAAVWASRTLTRNANAAEAGSGSLFGNLNNPANFAVQLPALSATLPFLLLIMVTVRLPLTNPSPVFALALLLVALLLGMTGILSFESLSAVALGSVLALEHAWHFHHFRPD